jgi:hypothetical protein
MPDPIDNLRAQYVVLGQTVDSALKRLNGKNPDVAQEGVVVQGAYLFGVRAFEYFIESQMVHLCHPAATWGPKAVGGQTRRFVRKLSDPNANRVKSVLLMGSTYADYLPYDRTEKRAEVLFAKGRPFSLLESKHREVIKRAFTTRNLIAHESDHSLKTFEKVVCSRYPLTADRRNAAGYLLHEAIKGLPMAKQDLAGLLDAATFLS